MTRVQDKIIISRNRGPLDETAKFLSGLLVPPTMQRCSHGEFWVMYPVRADMERLGVGRVHDDIDAYIVEDGRDLSIFLWGGKNQ